MTFQALAPSLTRPLLTLILLCLFSACQEQPEKQGSVSNTPLGDGYSLMYDLLGKQANVDMVLIIKNAEEDTSGLIKEIASFSGDNKVRLEALASLAPEPSLDTPHLPALESEAREAAQSSQQELLLGNSGKDFERRLLLTQYQSMGYLANLSQALQKHEENSERIEFLKEIETRAVHFREKTYQRLRDL